MKKFTLLLVMLLAVVGVNAKTKTTTLWKGTDTGADIEVAMSELVKGATLNLTFNWLGSGDGAQFRCFWWNSSTSAWVYIKDWQWVNNGDSYSFTLTDGEFDAITSDKLCFKTLAPAEMTFAQITQTETLEPTPIGENLLSEDWVVAVDGWENRDFAPQTTAKIGDVIQIEITVASGWKYTEVQVKDSEGSDLENTSKYVGNFAEETSATFEFEINNINDLKKIRSTGFSINASNHATISSIKLLTYADSYGYITITIPEVGTIPKVGYATWSSDKKYDFKSAGLQAYYASDVTTGSVTLTPMDIAWDYQGYIIKGSAGAHDVLESLTKDGSYYPSTNYLKYNIGEANVYDSEKNRYIFAMKTGDASSVGFYKLTADHTLGAHKAYLETPTDIAPTARVAIIFDDEETTGVKEVKGLKAETRGEYYDLMGRKVAQPTRGLYIVNGKKVVIK